MIRNFVFASPFWLIGLGVALYYIFYAEKKMKDKNGAIFFPLGFLLSSVSGRKFWFGRISYILSALFIAFLSLALSRPTLKISKTVTSTEGIAIILTMDVSGSMLAEDFQPSNRMDVARQVLSDFVEKRENDRIGLVTFAGMPFLRCPLTTDHKTLMKLLSDMKAVRRQELDGTAIGDALISSGQRLITAVEKSKVVVLVTDGENNKGQFDPILAAKMLKERNIKVYSVGIGTKGLVPYPVVDQSGQKSYQFVKIGFNEESLKKIAEETNGKYFSASDKDALENVFAEIDKLEKSKIESPTYVIRRELFMYPLSFSLIFICFLFLWEFGLGRKIQ
ncbi:MAG: VWA domain-containing protein [Acidobacteria bacterium]|nr:VWA domain-containing protein [Acidobacteriota bacterium]